MALTQHTLTVTPPTTGAYVARGSWASGLVTPKLVGAVPVLPTETNAAALTGVSVRARLDGATVTVEASSPALLTPLDVLLTLDS